MRLRTVAAGLLLWTIAALPCTAQTAAPAVSYRFHYAAAGDAAATVNLEWDGPLS